MPKNRGPYLVAVVLVVLLVALGGRYGFHRDELYFVEGGHHPAWAQPDNPMLVPLLARFWYGVTGGNLLLFRVLPALVSGATVVLAAATSRIIGGSPRQQTLTAAVMASCSILLGTGHLFSTTTFDLALTTASIWLLIRALQQPQELMRWLLLGVVTGVGMEVKILPVLVLLSCLAGVATLGPRRVLRQRGPWLAMIVALALAAPNLIWQVANGWPMLGVAADIAAGGSVSSSSRAMLVPMHLLMAGPLGAVVLIVGLIAPFRVSSLRAYRWVTVAYGVMLVLALGTGGKPYYLAGFFAVAFALGVGPLAGFVGRSRPRVLAAAVIAVLLVGPTVVFALPVAPAGSPVFQVAVTVNPDQAETVGWDALVERVQAASSELDPGTGIVLTRNYGEAGALDQARRREPGALPPVYSGHNAYGRWGPPPDDRVDAVVVGRIPAADLERWFTTCEDLSPLASPPGVDNEEDGAPLRVCRGRLQPWSQIWPEVVHLG